MNYNIYEIITKIIGKILPIGETNTDEARLKNLTVHCNVTHSLLKDIILAASYRDRQEYSVQKAGEEAYRSLVEIKKLIDEVIDPNA